jgi:hypothetical protein
MKMLMYNGLYSTEYFMQISRSLSIFLTIGLVQISLPLQTQASERTVVKNSFAAKQLLGNHKVNLQWIAWDNWEEFGDLRVFEREGTLFIKGRQTKSDDYLEIDGEVLNVDAREFTFQGSIVTRVSHKNEGNPCERYGKMVFKITEKRKYWRLQEMQSPCDVTTDYVDIFMR